MTLVKTYNNVLTGTLNTSMYNYLLLSEILIHNTGEVGVSIFKIKKYSVKYLKDEHGNIVQCSSVDCCCLRCLLCTLLVFVCFHRVSVKCGKQISQPVCIAGIDVPLILAIALCVYQLRVTMNGLSVGHSVPMLLC